MKGLSKLGVPPGPAGHTGTGPKDTISLLPARTKGLLGSSDVWKLLIGRLAVSALKLGTCLSNSRRCSSELAWDWCDRELLIAEAVLVLVPGATLLKLSELFFGSKLMVLSSIEADAGADVLRFCKFRISTDCLKLVDIVDIDLLLLLLLL